MNENLKELYRKKSKLLEKFKIAKDSAENKQLWEDLPASERVKYAKWYFEYCQREIEAIDEEIKNIKKR
ncbi:MAG: hypothetical protein COX49_06040 [bacterium (Candidatus Stahlbacteria) CG23_combo_of_CG06-09_8_20_14_all_40_9]|nr:MAG: hypothetical protein COX49_06040 [bacterium (Candidatus Stahlbacteria) CG23_combo_of_CG06-09_8_20_14_all_40_9]